MDNILSYNFTHFEVLFTKKEVNNRFTKIIKNNVNYVINLDGLGE